MSNPFSNGVVIGAGVDPEAYHKKEFKRGDRRYVMSRGELMEFNVCPRRWMSGFESSETRPQQWGSLVDCLALSPKRFNDRFIVAPETYPSEAKKGEPTIQKPWNWNATFCKEWREQHDGLQIIKTGDKKSAEDAVARLMADEIVASVFNSASKQVLAQAEYCDAETGVIVPVKILIDALPDGDFKKAIADLKTCNCAASQQWARSVFTYNYHVQAAFYLDVYNCATGEKRNEFLHILQESFPPFEIGRRMLSAEFIGLGREKYLHALKRYCRCLASNTWPGYDDDAKDALNGWQLTEPEQWMEIQSMTNYPPAETNLDEVFK